MTSWPALRCWTLAACVAAVFAAVLILLQAPGADAPAGKVDAGQQETHSWPMLGGGVHRNMVNLFDKNIPTAWSLKTGAESNVKWSAPWVEGLWRPRRLRRQDLRRHQQQHAAGPCH